MAEYIRVSQNQISTIEKQGKAEGLVVSFINDYVRFDGSTDLIARIALNKKYYVYDRNTSQPALSEEESFTILQVVASPIGKFVVFVSRSKKIGFLRTDSSDEDLPIIIKSIENIPYYRQRIFNFRGSFKIIGVFKPRLSYAEVSDYYISAGYSQNRSGKIKFLFSEKLRMKTFKKRGRIMSKIMGVLNLYTITIRHDDIYQEYQENSEINLPLYIGFENKQMNEDNVEISYMLKERSSDKRGSHNYLFRTPSKQIKGSSNEVYIRKTLSGQLKIEITDLLSKRVYVKEAIGKVMALFGAKNRAIYFEKFSEGATESSYELFKYAMLRQDEISEKNVFILTKTSLAYPALKKDYPKNVYAKNSVLAFYNIFCAKYLISSDLASHIQRRLYDNSKWIKKTIIEAEKIFLQHGVCLCTNVFARGYFSTETVYAPSKIVMTSSMEKDLFLKNTYFKDEQLLLTGLPNLDNYVRYKETGGKQTAITFMLTWRPWDLSGAISQGSYIDRYLTFIELTKNDPFFKDVKINVVLHPKARLILENQFKNEYLKIKDYIYTADIKDALLESSVLITDYSSIMFYAFAGGSNLIYYWEDKLKAESEYGSANIMQADIAFGDIVFDMESVIAKSKERYNNEQVESYQQKYNELVDCRFGNNTKNTFEALFIKKQRS